MNSSDDTPHFRTTLDSPVGALSLVATDRALVALVWRTAGHSRVPFEAAVEDPQHPVLRETARQLENILRARAGSSICRSNSAAPTSSAASGPRCS